MDKSEVKNNNTSLPQLLIVSIFINEFLVFRKLLFS